MSDKRVRVDWDALEPHFRAGIRSLKDLAREFGCSDAGIIKHGRDAGWVRNLTGKIQAKANAKVTAALVKAETGETQLTEAICVEVEAQVQARIRLSHQQGLTKLRERVERLIERCETDSDDFKSAIFATKAMAEAYLKLLPLERQAYGVDTMVMDPTEKTITDPMEGARRIAFVLARAEQAAANDQRAAA